MYYRINDTADSDAEDIIQDVALKVFSRQDDAMPINNIASFVYNAVRNKIIDTLRTRKTKDYDENNLEQLWTEFSERFYTESEDAYSDATKERLKQTLFELKPVYRDIIIAIDFEGYTYKEIAQKTGIAPGTLMSRRHRAMSILLKKMEQNKKLDYENH